MGIDIKYNRYNPVNLDNSTGTWPNWLKKAVAAVAVVAIGSSVAAATTAFTIVAGAFIGLATFYGMAVVSAASTSRLFERYSR